MQAGAQSQQDGICGSGFVRMYPSGRIPTGRVNMEQQRKKGKKPWHRASCDARFLRENQPKAKIKQHSRMR